METETEEYLHSGVNHESGNGRTSVCSTEAETDSVPSTSLASSASVKLTSQTSKCERVMTEG